MEDILIVRNIADRLSVDDSDLIICKIVDAVNLIGVKKVGHCLFEVRYCSLWKGAVVCNVKNVAENGG